MAKNYWMIAGTLEGLKAWKEAGVSVLQVPSTYRRRAQRMQPEDRILYYIPGTHKFGGVSTVTSASLEGQPHVERGRRRGGSYSLKISITPDVMLGEERYLDAREIGPRMEYVRNWPPESWYLAFQGNFHLLSRKDFQLIEAEMKREAKGRSFRPKVLPAEQGGQHSHV